jgi:acyl-CoA thioesterase-2
VRIERYPYAARAWAGQTLLAESAACLCVETEGETAALYFPHDDIVWSHLRVHGSDDAPGGAGTSELWTAEGQQVLRLVTEPTVGLDALGGHGTFDPERVCVEVVDADAGTDARDVTLKRFPTWGDATHLIDLLNVQPGGECRFVGGVHSDGRRPVVEASQMLGQAIVAGSRHAPDRRAIAAELMVVRPADARRPLAFELDELSAGRTFTGLAVRVLQDGRCCAAGTLLLDATAPSLIDHAADPPDVPGPYDCTPHDMAVTGRDLRVVDDAYTNDSDAPLGPPVLDCWVRFRHVPDDQALHAGLLAQFAGHMPIAAALRPHQGIGQDQAHRTLSMGINAIHLSIHREIRADRWMLYHHRSTFAGDGMTHAECRVHAEDGALLASFSVEAMVRAFPDSAVRDERTAL